MFSIVPPAMTRRRARVRLVRKSETARTFVPFSLADALMVLSLLSLVVGAVATAAVLS